MGKKTKKKEEEEENGERTQRGRTKREEMKHSLPMSANKPFVLYQARNLRL